MDERLQKQIDFILEIDKSKNILRQTHLTHHGRRENDAEHAWHMAIMAYLLQEYSNEKIDVAKVMLMLLIHDLVEIDAGDTYAYDNDGLKTQASREKKAEDRLFSMLPADQGQVLKALFEEFNAEQTPEAKFARVMDNFQPLLLNNSNDGMDWTGHDISANQVYGRQNRSRPGSEKLFQITNQIIKENIQKEKLK
ncbi:putative hydrolases of HD superfamily [Ligilactobacillus sp. WC1T17]|uniref:Hydrolases of HD superfamily n=1 Tax=Ligilactobacillus ruminis TaxID=1623 RepID=A0ABY1AD93_9LACO|nr:putative hydrolases of HD superfamily [Ligilactobacillus ruminis]